MRGVAVKPRQGDALLFFSMDVRCPSPSLCLPLVTPPPPRLTRAPPSASCAAPCPSVRPQLKQQLDMASLHAGCPVIKGEKWSATKWHAPSRRIAAPAPARDAHPRRPDPIAIPHLRLCDCALPRRRMHVGEFQMEAKKRRRTADKCADEHDSCKQWAESGECERNPAYMVSGGRPRGSLPWRRRQRARGLVRRRLRSRLIFPSRPAFAADRVRRVFGRVPQELREVQIARMSHTGPGSGALKESQGGSRRVRPSGEAWVVDGWTGLERGPPGRQVPFAIHSVL